MNRRRRFGDETTTVANAGPRGSEGDLGRM